MAKISSTKTVTIRGAGTFILEAYFESEQNNNNVTNNTSSVYAKATLTKGTGSFSYSTKQGTLSIYWHDNKTNKDVLWKSLDVSKLMSGSVSVSLTKNVNHKDDGTLSGYAKAVWTKASGGSQYAPASGSVSTDTKTFDTIARASEPTVNVTQATLGTTTVTISTNKKADFTHTLVYTINGSNEVEIATGVVDSKTWTPPLSIANNLPNNTEGTVVIKCKTYNGSTLIGTKETNLKVLVPDSIVPTISDVEVSEADSTMISKNWGIYVQGKSKLKVETTASGVYGSTIKAYKITGIDSDTFSSSVFTSDVLKTVGAKKITVTVTDTRNRTTSTTVDYTCFAYEKPKIESVDAQRCDSTGKLTSEGTYLKYSFKASISPVDNKNNVQKYEVGYKASGASTYTYKTIASSGYSLNQENIILSNVTFANTTQYDIVFRVTDAFGIPTTINKVLSTVDDLINCNASGKSMAFGKASEATQDETKLEVALDTYFSKSVNIGSKTLQKFIEDILLESDKKKYPVGTILMSSANTNPASYLKFGTWVAWGSGKVPVGVDTNQTEFNAVEKIGGEKTHVLTIEESAGHTHGSKTLKGTFETRGINNTDDNPIMSATGICSVRRVVWSGSHDVFQRVNVANRKTNYVDINASHKHDFVGGGQAHNNLQPYITCYMWKRTQ